MAGVARGQGALTLPEHLVPPLIVKQFVLFSEGLLKCLYTVSLINFVHSYLE